MLFLYRIYQILIAAPVILAATVLAALLTAIGCSLGGGRWWGYYPAHLWGRIFCWMTLVKVTVNGRENITPNTSYVFVANHQGAYDIFSIYGWLNHDFRWMMKIGLRKIPLVGYSCEKAQHIFVDKSTPAALRRTMDRAEHLLSGGMSVVVFPEGARSRNGKMSSFKRGAFLLAQEFNLPVVPITINGAFDVMPRYKKLPRWGHITLTIHRPIKAGANGHDMSALLSETHSIIESSLTVD